MGKPPQGVSGDPGGARPEQSDFGALLGRKSGMIKNYEKRVPIPEKKWRPRVACGQIRRREPPIPIPWQRNAESMLPALVSSTVLMTISFGANHLTTPRAQWATVFAASSIAATVTSGCAIMLG